MAKTKPIKRRNAPRRGAELDRTIAAARARGDATRDAGLLATSARYDAMSRRLMLEMTNGMLIGLPIQLLPEVANASAAELSHVEVLGAGGAIAWDGLGADYSVPALVTTFVGTAAVTRELGRIGGSVTSKAKANAARANGAKGGRPPRIAKKAVVR